MRGGGGGGGGAGGEAGGGCRDDAERAESAAGCGGGAEVGEGEMRGLEVEEEMGMVEELRLVADAELALDMRRGRVKELGGTTFETKNGVTGALRALANDVHASEKLDATPNCVV
eukprot:113644-Prymnesium_polylepis.1